MQAEEGFVQRTGDAVARDCNLVSHFDIGIGICFFDMIMMPLNVCPMAGRCGSLCSQSDSDRQQHRRQLAAWFQVRP